MTVGRCDGATVRRSHGTVSRSRVRRTVARSHGPVAVLLALVLCAPAASAQTPDSLVPRDSVGRLWAPGAVQMRDATTPRDDEELIKTLEGRIRCTCGCNLDVFTCRTTDFTCATSPAMHRVVLARIDSGMTADQVLAAFETQYGQSIFMQPPKRGFNWLGYVMPFIGLGLGVGIVLMTMKRIVRRRPVVLPAEPGAPPPDGGGGVDAPPGVSDEDMEKLRRELEHFEA